jgi:hypothetical protein
MVTYAHPDPLSKDLLNLTKLNVITRIWTSVSEPDPHESAFDFGRMDPDPDPGGQK